MILDHGGNPGVAIFNIWKRDYSKGTVKITIPGLVMAGVFIQRQNCKVPSMSKIDFRPCPTFRLFVCDKVILQLGSLKVNPSAN